MKVFQVKKPLQKKNSNEVKGWGNESDPDFDNDDNAWEDVDSAAFGTRNPIQTKTSSKNNLESVASFGATTPSNLSFNSNTTTNKFESTRNSSSALNSSKLHSSVSQKQTKMTPKNDDLLAQIEAETMAFSAPKKTPIFTETAAKLSAAYSNPKAADSGSVGAWDQWGDW